MLMNNNLKTVSMECGQCNSVADHRYLLHDVRLRGIYRRLCTSCVLKLHPGSFCPTCFDLFDPSTPYHGRVICQKCPSISHPSCIPCSVDSKTYTCPPCSSANFSFFDIKRKIEESGGGEVKGIDEKAATVLYCAARIASVSMSKAMGVARAEAERRVREAALSKKRAREAMENVAALAAGRKGGKIMDGVPKGSSLVHEHGKEKCYKISNGGNSATLGKQNRPESKVKVGSPMLGSSSKVSSNLGSNVVGKKEFDVKYKSVGSLSIPSVTTAVKKEKMENFASLNHTNAEFEKEKNGLLPPPKPVEGHLRLKETSNNLITKVKKGKNELLPPSNPVDESMLPAKESNSSYNVEMEKAKNELLVLSAVEGQLPTKEATYSGNMEVEKASNGLLLRKESSDVHNAEIEMENNGLLPPNPVDEGKLPSEEDSLSHNIEVEMEDSVLLPPNMVEERQLPLEESSVSNSTEVEKANNEPLPPVEESLLKPKPCSCSHNEEAENADNGLVLPRLVEEGKLQITDSNF